MKELAATVYSPPRARSPWRLQDLYAPSALRLYGYGRTALSEALKMAGASGGRVLLPVFVCRDLLSAVIATGAEPAFYETKSDLTPLKDPASWPEARAVLAVDYFGFPQDLGPFEAYAKRSGAVVIEDAAHALFSRDKNGRLLGSRAGLGILSLRKSLAVANGGALIATDPTLIERLPPQLAFKPAPGWRPILKALARPLLAGLSARAAHAMLTGLRSLRGDSSGHVGSDSKAETVLPEPAEPCPELERPIRCADPALEASRRRALWLRCDELARKAGLSPVFSSLPDGIVPYAYAFRSKDLGAARALFTAEGLTTLPWPDLPEAVMASVPTHDREVGLIHFLW